MSRDSIEIPGDIREILEATYGAAGADEIGAWKELRLELERRAATLRRQALNATRVWGMPALADDEGVQTRYSQCPTATLVLVKDLRAEDGVKRIRGLEGVLAEVTSRWNLATAKALHRTSVRVPRWALGANPFSPEWLSRYVPGTAAIGVVGTDGQIVWPDRKRQAGLSYHHDEGVVIQSSAAPDRAGQLIGGPHELDD